MPGTGDEPVQPDRALLRRRVRAEARHGGDLEYPFVRGKGVLNGYSSTRVSLWDSLMFGRLAMGFANVRASRYGTR